MFHFLLKYFRFYFDLIKSSFIFEPIIPFVSNKLINQQ